MEPISVVTFVLLAVMYAWTLYSLPILLKGLRGHFELERKLDRAAVKMPERFPSFSVLVAAKNEGVVLGRLLSRLVELDYPRDHYEVIVVEDGSRDQTADVGREYASKFPQLIRFYHREISSGKPAALNYGLSLARGEIIAVLDADNFPDLDLLRSAAKYFDDPSVAAVQGMTRPINEDENFFTKISASEEAAWFRPYILGKERLGLFVPLTGSCGFVRREILDKLGGWENSSIAEDIELAARIVKHNGKIRYATDVQSFQEYPSSARQFIGQRTRWFRGYMETFVKYGTLLRNPSKVTVDAEATLGGPLVLNLALLTYAVTFTNLLMPSRSSSDLAVVILADAASVLTVATLLLCGVAIFCNTRPIRVRSFLWIPIVYMYWFLQTAVAARAFLQMVLRRPAIWVKTEKTGRATLNQH